MPRGIYIRTKAIRDAIRRARLGTKVSELTKQKQRIIHRKIACNPIWRKHVSEGTRNKMRLPHIRKKHLVGLRNARAKHGINFKGGNGQKQVEFVRYLASSLLPLGYIQEHPVPTGKGKGHHYKLYFALIEKK